MSDDTRPDLPPLPSAAEIVRYMRSAGWAHGRQGSRGAMWAKGDVEFSVPHEDDRPSWLREVVGRLASAESRTPEETAAAVAAHRDAGAATKDCGCGPLEPCGEHLGRGSVAPVSAPAVTSPAPAPAKPPAASTVPSAPVSEAAVQAALDAVALFWREAHAILQAYPSAALARAMLEGAAPLIRAAERERLGVIPLSETLTDEQVAEFRERFEAAVANPGPLRVLPSDGWRERAERAEAQLAEIRQIIAAFLTHHGNSAVFALRSARDLAEGIRQVLDRAAALEAPEDGGTEPG